MWKLTIVGWVGVVVVALLGIATAILAIVEVVTLTAKSSIPDSGTVPINGSLEDYGFGQDKWLLMIDLTEQFGTVANIDLKDKYHATMAIYRSGAQVGDPYDIGIEIKGRRDRVKLNYGIEYWVPDEDKPGSYKDDDTTFPMFDGQQGADDEEDYVLRGGFMEPTLTRDAFAAQVGFSDYPSNPHGSVGYPAQLVELIFKTDKGYTYEGVYLFMYDLGRKSIRGSYKSTDTEWNGKGKKKDCKDWNGDAVSLADVKNDVAKVFLMMEYTVQDHKEVEDACGRLPTEASIQMEYPKCDFFEEYVTECETTGRTQYTDAYAGVALYRSLPDHPEFSRIHMPSFVWHFVFEMIMLSDDFPFASQFFWVPPATTSQSENSDPPRQMRAGPPYDYDGVFWRVLQRPKGSWTMGRPTDWNEPSKIELTNRNYYGKAPMELWKQLGKHDKFLQLVRSSGATVLQKMKAMHDEILTKRNAELANGYWDRNNERWKPYGKAYIAGTARADFWVHRSAVLTQDSMAKELAYIKDWTDRRVSKLQAWMPQLTSYGVNDDFNTVGEILRKLLPFIILTLVFVLCLVLLLVAICLRTRGVVVVRAEDSYTEVAKETATFQTDGKLPPVFLGERAR